MIRIRTLGTTVKARIVVMGLIFVVAEVASAHCDSMNGPVVPEARAALEKGDITPVLKWVGQENEAEIRAAFARSVSVRAKGSEAKELADRYFLETLVRLHRAGEGAPYTGIKDEPVERVVAMADRSLAEGSADEMIEHIGAHLAKAIREKFNRAAAAAKHKDENVAAGREFVAAYVAYVHYVEGIHTAMMATGAHHGESAEDTAGRGH